LWLSLGCGRCVDRWWGRWLMWCKCEKPPGTWQPALRGETMPEAPEAVAVEVV
jgi:hypothetical protein